MNGVQGRYYNNHFHRTSPMAKYFISGGSGSGKSTYAKQLSEQLNIPHFDLDDIYWITYGHSRPKRERDIMLNKILTTNPSWIIEGVYSSAWVIPIINDADKIIIINPPTWKRQWRIIKRYLVNRFDDTQNSHNETLTSVSKLLHWSQQYESKYLPELIHRIQNAHKTYTLTQHNKTK